MDPFYLIVVIILLALAITDLMVGVANDAVNFLNSSIGSKVAPRWVILLVASVGVIVGTLFSSGMMEVARKGVFFPEQFTFPSIMLLFLAVMLTDVILLDVFNTFGLPTSSTVSLVFELLGAAVAVSLVMIARNGAGELSQYINSSKALAIISGIFISIAVAFLVGSTIMFISRIIFSFKYEKAFTYLGSIWGGIALTAITYFAVFKGLKGSVLISDDFLSLLHDNMARALLYSFLGWTVLMLILQFVFRLKILNFIVLSGTLALALAFASNDLVNFIGVFMAGLDSYEIGKVVHQAGGDLNTLYMGELAKPVKANWQWLLGAGLVMIIALWSSKKARTVTETEVNLARSGGGVERFASSTLSRSLVRGAVNINKAVGVIVPKKVSNWVEERFETVPVENGASFDLIRASVNLTVAALLISLGTSLKLPLSTTYVTFMVAMGSSLADRAWGRESAVYRINGVLTVVAGWLLTALIAFTASLVIGLFLMWGGKIAVVIMILVAAFTMFQSNVLHSKRKAKEDQHKTIMSSEDQLVMECNNDAKNMLVQTKDIFAGTIEALSQEDRKLMKKTMLDAGELYTLYKDKRSYEVVPTIETIQANALDLEHEYVRMVDFSYEISKSLKAMTESSFLYIDSNHSPLTKAQLDDLKTMYNNIVIGFENFWTMMDSRDYSDYDNSIVASRDAVYALNNKFIKRQIKRLKNGESKTRASILFLDLVNEIKIIMIQSSNLMKSQKNFNEQYKIVENEMSADDLVKNAGRRI